MQCIESESDIQPSMVTHTQNSYSTLSHPSAHTHISEHTPGAMGSHLCCGARGAIEGSVPCSRAPRRGIEGGRERCIHSPSYNLYRPETQTRNLSNTSPTLYH